MGGIVPADCGKRPIDGIVPADCGKRCPLGFRNSTSFLVFFSIFVQGLRAGTKLGLYQHRAGTKTEKK